MVRILALILLFIPLSSVLAQDEDSLFVVKKESNWEIRYTAKDGEHAKMLAKRFYLSYEQLEYANSEGVMKKLSEGNTVYIPVIKDNFYVIKPPRLSAKNLMELYYKVAPRDEIAILATYAGVTKNEFREWNNLKGNTLKQGQVLFVGWIKMMKKDSTNPASLAAWPGPIRMDPAVDTSEGPPVPGGLDTVYDRQTNLGMNVLSEKGTAVFFEKPGKATMYYAFHNEAARGSVIKVYNPGSGKSTYVKVLGPLPDTKLFANCIIGITAGAKEALGIINDNKAWCELFYAAD